MVVRLFICGVYVMSKALDPYDSKHWSLDSILAAKNTFDLKRPLLAAVEALEKEPGKLESREADYEIACYVEDGFRITIYPHKTRGTGNIGLRIRLAGKRSDRARYIMTLLYNCSPHDTHFSWKHQSMQERHSWEKEFGFFKA